MTSIRAAVKKIKQKLELPPEFKSLATDNLPATALYATKYLAKRGISKSDIIKWKIGFCFEGEFRNRIIIPSFDEEGDCSYFYDCAGTCGGPAQKVNNDCIVEYEM